jgi:hypothetical protein
MSDNQCIVESSIGVVKFTAILAYYTVLRLVSHLRDLEVGANPSVIRHLTPLGLLLLPKLKGMFMSHLSLLLLDILLTLNLPDLFLKSLSFFAQVSFFGNGLVPSAISHLDVSGSLLVFFKHLP